MGVQLDLSGSRWLDPASLTSQTPSPYIPIFPCLPTMSMGRESKSWAHACSAVDPELRACSAEDLPPSRSGAAHRALSMLTTSTGMAQSANGARRMTKGRVFDLPMPRINSYRSRWHLSRVIGPAVGSKSLGHKRRRQRKVPAPMSRTQYSSTQAGSDSADSAEIK